MYRLRDLKNGKYQIHSEKHGAFEGTPITIFKTAIKMGVKQNELKMAVNTLHSSGDDYADFGIFGCFLYTGKGMKHVV